MAQPPETAVTSLGTSIKCLTRTLPPRAIATIDAPDRKARASLGDGLLLHLGVPTVTTALEKVFVFQWLQFRGFNPPRLHPSGAASSPTTQKRPKPCPSADPTFVRFRWGGSELPC